VTLAALNVFYDGPSDFAPRASWVLDTLLAPLGRQGRLVRDRTVTGGCALAYAASPVPGVPTIPLSSEAMELFATGRALPRGIFSAAIAGAGSVPAPVAAFPASADAGFAAPADLIASAFALLACWDEHTSSERDRFGRLPYSSSVFAANAALRIEEPAVDGYVALLRSALAPRLAALGLDPPAPSGWMWSDAGGYALALTHDVDNLWRWTTRGFVAAAYRSARAVRQRRWTALRKELGDVVEWATAHLPRNTDPFWTFPQLLAGEDHRHVSSTFFVIARHTDRRDGNQPKTYQRRIPLALDMIRCGRREVGLHGNAEDRLGTMPLLRDRTDLAERAGGEVDGIRYHYLRCLYHETLDFVEQAGFAYDTSLAFAEHEGFRCGTSFPFRPYDLQGERPRNLVELPLAIMDTSLLEPQYRHLEAAAAEQACRDIVDRVRSGGGGVTVLWHNNRFDRRSARGYDDVYWRLVEQATAEGAFVGSAGQVVDRWLRQTAGTSELAVEAPQWEPA
jgi:hypothetical protein